MLKIDRYILREVFTPAAIAVFTLTFIFFTTRNGKLLEIVIRQLATASELWIVSSALMPTILSITLPMGLLVGVLTAFGRMSSDSETIAFRASGVSMFRLLRPVIVLALAFSALTLVLTVWVAPATFARANAMRDQLAAKAIQLELQPGVFNDRLDRVFFVSERTADSGLEFRRMLVAEGSPENPKVTFAEAGSITHDEAARTYQLRLFNASTLEVPSDAPEKDRLSTVREVSSEIPMAELQAGRERSPAEISTRELWEQRKAGSASLAHQIEFHQRLAMPFACFALAIIAFPLGVSTRRGGKSVGLVFSLVLMLVYYLGFMGGTRLASGGTLSPWAGAWIPNLGYLALGTMLLFRADREYENRILVFLGNIVEWLGAKTGRFNPRRLNISRWAYAPRQHGKFIRVLDLYVLRGFLFYLSLVLMVFYSLFAIVTLFEMLSQIANNNISLFTVVVYFVYFTPQILYYVVPLAVLLAILITLGTLTKTNEVLAVKAGAVSLYRLSTPLILVSALICGGVYLMQDFVLPYTNRRQDEYRDMIAGRQPQTYGDPGRKWMKGSNDRIYYYGLFNPDTNVFGNISVFTVNPTTFALQEWTFARKATWNGAAWKMEQGWTRRVSEDRSLSYQSFEEKEWEALDQPDYFKKEVRESDQMHYAELRRYVADFRQSGFDVTRLTLDLYKKLSFPLVSVIMALIGIPFSFKTGRKGAFYGIGLCVAVGLSYWSMIELFDKLGGINRLEPLVAAWFPNLIFGTAGLWMFLRIKT